MEQGIDKMLFALLGSAVCGTRLTKEEYKKFSPELLKVLMELASKHDVAHLLVFSMQHNGLLTNENKSLENHILKAIYRHERMRYEYENLCKTLENAQIPFMPLKGSVIRKYYPNAWMRVSCDIDILVHCEDLEATISYLSDKLNYVEKERATHDVSLFTPTGIHVELHFDLLEEGRANNAINVLQQVWDNASLCDNSKYCYEMNDSFFYFYHIAHMAKHFETGGCGLRPFLDLWILDHLRDFEQYERDELLAKGGLLRFANVSRNLCQVWFDGKEMDGLSRQIQEFILHGGVYGSADNKVALQQSRKGGRVGYIVSRIFIPFAKLKRYYPILNKHPWLMPFMQVRRWFMLLKPDVAKMAKSEIITNGNLEKSRADEMNIFLENIGL